MPKRPSRPRRIAGLLLGIVLATASPPPAAAADEATPPAGPEPARSFWLSLLEDHWRHVAIVLGASAADHAVDARIGPRDSPLFFSDPPALDREAQERFGGGSGMGGFVQAHATPVTRAVAAAIIFSANGPRWRDDVNDFVGLWEAQRFNTAATGLVKDAVGRERPKLQAAQEDDPASPETARLDRRPDQHRSFWSFHASSAFTTLSYADLVLSRRLQARPAWRRWSRTGLYALAGYIAWQRIEENGHWLTDVVAGSLAGTWTGRSFYAFNHHDGVDRWLSFDPPRARRVSFALPAVTPRMVIVSARIPL